MARLDIQSFHNCKKFKKRQREDQKEFQEFYHALAAIYRELNSSENKELLVREYPKLSAQVFYYFGDDELGSMIVRNYAFHNSGEYRQLAERVKNLLRLRSSEKSKLEVVLNMGSIITFEKEATFEEYE